MKRSSWFIFLVLFTLSCLDEPDCFQLHNDILGITFRVIGTGQGDSVLLKNFSRSGADTIVTSFGTQLNYFVEAGSFTFVGAEKTNNLEFGYTVKNQFVSEECGSSFVLSDIRVKNHDFDSVRIINSSPTKTGGPNIEIYRCPETDTLTIDFNQLLATTNGITVSNPRSAYISQAFDPITFQYGAEVFSGRAATVKLPVDLVKLETAYVFTTDIAKDTLIIGYNLTTERRYRPCGTQTFVSNIRVKYHTFDSLSFALNSEFEPIRTPVDPQVSNLRVFNCPPTNILQVGFKNSANAAQTVTIKSIKADHITGEMLTAQITTNVLTLPVDLASDASTFYITYENGTVETLSVSYTRSSLRLFDSCDDPVITGLRETTDLPNIAILPTRTTLQYPTATNVEIIVN